MKRYKERFENMFLYLSVGDALGKICSKYNKEEINRIYGGSVSKLIKPIRTNSKRDWQKADVTDDTILTLLVADSLIENREFDRRDIARKLIAVDPRGGRQIEFLKRSNDVDYIATTGDTNGAAIRVSPLSAVYSDLEKLTRNVFSLSNLTHGSNESISAALAVAYSLHFNLKYPIYSPIKIQDFIIGSLLDHFPESQDTKFLCNLVEAFNISQEVRSYDLPDILEGSIGYGKESWSSVPTGIVLGSKLDDPYNAFISIIHRNNSGWDLDSVASIAGSLLGLRVKDKRVVDMGREVEYHNNYNFGFYAQKLEELRLKNGY